MTKRCLMTRALHTLSTTVGAGIGTALTAGAFGAAFGRRQPLFEGQPLKATLTIARGACDYLQDLQEDLQQNSSMAV
jgi:hypothetical protein